jgi:pSer/pThr/pTyr-binding forkhead associated (FHA) protein
LSRLVASEGVWLDHGSASAWAQSDQGGRGEAEVSSSTATAILQRAVGTGCLVHLMPIQGDMGSDPLAPHSLSANELEQLLEAERAGKPFLAFRDQDGALGLFVTGGADDTRSLGRRAEMDLSIPWDSEVSGLHAELQGVAGEWMIVDDGLSTNGTFLNGERVNGRQRLKDGDRIRIGRTVLAFKAASSASAQETVLPGAQPTRKQLTDTQRQILIALCRPYRDGGSFASPATNQQIADEVFLSVDAVKMHLRTLFAKFELGELPQNQKRASLAERALQFGVISQRELA